MIYLRARDGAALHQAAEKAWPFEACALLVGRRGLGDQRFIDRVEWSENRAPDPARQFEIDPGLRIGLERALRGDKDGRAVIGAWHSHPGASAWPSRYDAARMDEKHLVWIITALHDGRATETRAFLPRNADGFRPLDIHWITE